MYTYKLDACNDKQFIFEFTFESDDGEEYNDSNSPYVSYRLLRMDKPTKVFEWHGRLTREKSETFKLSFLDEIDIKGSMRLYRNDDGDFIWIDTWYCQNLEEHFEGNILEIPGHSNPPGPPIIPVDPLPNTDIPEKESVLSKEYNDLFPYLYVREWPDLTKFEETYFMTFVNDVGAKTLYNMFLSNFNGDTSKPGAREAILKETFDFINGKTAYKQKYLVSTRELKLPYKFFPVLYDNIQELCFTNKKELEDFVFTELGKDKKGVEKLVNSNDFKEIKDRVWQNVFALSVLGFYNLKTLQKELKILLICNLLEALFLKSYQLPIKISHLLKASVVLPVPVFPLPLANDTETKAGENGKTVIPYAIGDLHMTQHKLIGYQTGEIAHIENVLAGELKERSNASSHETTETSRFEDETNTSDDQIWEGSLEGLTNEINNTLTGTDTMEDDYKNLTTTYGPPTTLILKGSVTKTKTLDLKDDTKLTDFAKNVLNKSLVRMRRNIKQIFTKQQVNKTEEAVIHTLDNRNNEHNVRGIYNWVNKVYSTRVIDYGNRFLLEFLIDDPLPKLESYIALVEKGLIAPAIRKPAISSFEDINRKNYAALAADYGVMDVPLPPEEYISSFVFFNEDNVLTSQMAPISEGYIPFEAEVSYSIDEDIDLLVGATIIELSKENKTATDPEPTKTSTETLEKDKANTVSTNANTKISTVLEEGISTSTRAIPVVLTHMTSFTSPPKVGFYISVAVKSQSSSNLMNQWRIKVYDALIKAYRANIAKSKLAIDRLEHKNKVRRRALLNQTIKQNCKEILYHIYLKKNTEETIAEVLVDDSLYVKAAEPEYDQFFEQAMEWNESTYEFYDAGNPFSTGLINESIEDFIADRSFLDYFDQKKLRVMIPVTPDFNYKMLYYLSTGFVSYLQNLITPVVAEDKTIVVALKEVSERNHKSCVHNEPWEILVPTNMQWLQNEDELPFNSENNPIKQIS